MRLVNLVLVFFCYIFISSCGGNEENVDGVSIEAIPDLSYIVPGSDDSCLDRELRRSDPGLAGNSVSAYRVQFANFKLVWQKYNRKLTALFLRFQADHPSIRGGSYRATHDTEELDILLGVTGGAIGIRADGQDPIETESNPGVSPRPGNSYLPCLLKYGGIGLVDEEVSFATSGLLTFRGISAKSDDLDPRSVKATFRVRLRYEY